MDGPGITVQYVLSVLQPKGEISFEGKSAQRNDIDKRDYQINAETHYDDVIKKVGGYGKYQRIISFIIVLSQASYNAILYGMIFFFFPPKVRCLFPGKTYYDTCTMKQICEAQPNLPYQYVYDTERNSMYNFWDQLDLMCKTNTVYMMLGLMVLFQLLSSLLAPCYLHAFGMRNPLVISSFITAISCALMLFS